MISLLGRHRNRSAIALATDEPVYAGSGLIMQEDFDRYASATLMGAFPATYSAPRTVPIPGPITTSTPVDTAGHQVITGRSGSGKALRMLYDGSVNASANFETNANARPTTLATNYFQYWARITLASAFGGTIAVKWFEAWHNNFDRMQWNTHDHLPSPVATHNTYWQIYDQSRETTSQGNQPIPPWFIDVDDGQWHRFTYQYRCNTSNGARDGLARMWIDGTKMIDVSLATVGVTPPGGEKAWCLIDDVDAIANNDGIVSVRWGGPQTTASVAWTYDVDDFIWWAL